MKKVKKPTVSKVKKQAWSAFSLYIRTRDLEEGCFTCGRKIPLKKAQAGHWIPGRHPSVLFDPRNCHLQDFYCNIQLKGNPVVYYDKMLATYGKEVCEELKTLDKQIHQFKVFELIAIKEEYEAKLKDLQI